MMNGDYIVISRLGRRASMSGKSNLSIGALAAVGALTGAAIVAEANKVADAALDRNVTKYTRKAFSPQPCGLPPGAIIDDALRTRMEATSIAVDDRVREWLAGAVSEQVAISADNGRLHLVGCIYYAARPTRSWAVLAHDYRSTRRSMERFAEMYSHHGFNVLNVDLRAHGESEGRTIGMGWADGQDIIEWVGYLVARFGADISIVLHGQCMGAAAMVNASAWSSFPQVVALVSDSCPARFRQSAIAVLRDASILPSTLLYQTMRAMFLVRGGFDLDKADPIASAAQSATPALFLHGAADSFVPVAVAAELYDACAAPVKRLRVVPEAAHMAAFLVDPQDFESTVFAFLHEVGAVEYEGE